MACPLKKRTFSAASGELVPLSHWGILFCQMTKGPNERLNRRKHIIGFRGHLGRFARAQEQPQDIALREQRFQDGRLSTCYAIDVS